MSMHRSLKTQPGALNEHRNVRTRAERIARLVDQDRLRMDDDSTRNLPKVANRAVATGKQKTAAEGRTGAGRSCRASTLATWPRRTLTAAMWARRTAACSAV